MKSCIVVYICIVASLPFCSVYQNCVDTWYWIPFYTVKSQLLLEWELQGRLFLLPNELHQWKFFIISSFLYFFSFTSKLTVTWFTVGPAAAPLVPRRPVKISTSRSLWATRVSFSRERSSGHGDRVENLSLMLHHLTGVVCPLTTRNTFYIRPYMKRFLFEQKCRY